MRKENAGPPRRTPRSTARQGVADIATPGTDAVVRTVVPAPAPARRRRPKALPVGTLISAEQRHQMITETAYRLAEQDGFDAGRDLDHWLEAEALIEARLASRARG